jgi:ribosome-associated protein
MARHRITATIFLDDDDLVVEGIRASGPGGQNVNKVSSAVSLRLEVDRVAGMDHAMRSRLVRLAGRRLTEDGVLVIKAQEHRTQSANREHAVQRVVELLREAAIVPRKRIATRATRGSRLRRLETKKLRGDVKRQRRTAAEEP